MSERYDSSRRSHQDEIAENRRRFTTRIVELAAAVPLVGLAGKHLFKGNQHYEVDLEDALSSEKPQALNDLHGMSDRFNTALENLATVHREAYRHVETYTTVSMDMDGNPKMKTKTRVVWKEPKDMVDHKVVELWRDDGQELEERCAELKNKELVDLAKYKDIAVEKVDGDLANNIVAAMAYAAEIGLMLGYEEIHASASRRPNESVHEAKTRISTPEQIGRRSWIKVAATAVGAAAAYVFGKRQADRVDESGKQLWNDVKTMQPSASDGSSNAFIDYFETTPRQMQHRVKTILEQAKAAYGNDIEEPKVRQAFERVVQEADLHRQYLDSTFAGGVPLELDIVALRGNLTEELEEKTSKQRMGASGGLALEAALVGTAIAGTIGVGEYVNMKAPQDSEERA